MNKKIFFVLIYFLFFYTNQVTSQKNNDFSDTTHKRNVLKWNMTSFVLFSKKNINISYERIVKPYQSFSVNAGYFEVPFDGLFDSLFVDKTTKRSGFSVAGDYRFYFDKRNKKWAPDGLYWGLYGSYHHFQFENKITFINQPDIQGDVSFGGDFNIISAGAELGYQFIIKNRLSIDLVFMGPSIAAYQRKFVLGGNVNNQNEQLEAIWEALKNKYPFVQALAESGEIVNNEITTHMGFGMRYLVQIGYTF